jgi:hypothetical protein
MKTGYTGNIKTMVTRERDDQDRQNNKDLRSKAML